METKNILIGLGIAGAIGAYLYFNNKKNKPRPRPRNNGGASDTGNTTDTDDTDDTSDTDTPDTDTPDTTTGGTNVNTQTPDDVQIITAPSLTEEEILILSCNSVGGTWINSTCVYTNSPNPRNEVAQTDFDIDIFSGGSGTSGSLGAINTNPKTGYSTNTGTSYNNSSTPNYNLEFSGLKNWF